MEDINCVYMVSLGCPKNLVDSEIIAGNLLRNGIGISDDPARADVFLINTCAFIKPARNEAEEWIKKAVKWKKKRPHGKILVCGCLNQHQAAEEFRKKYADVDVWAGIDEIEKMVELINSEEARENQPQKKNVPRYLYNHKTDRIQTTPSHYAYLKILDGCDNRCSYCTIPGIRGTLRSRSQDSILKEAENFVRNGCRELILIAQDSTAYGYDLDGSYGHLPRLIKEMDDLGGDFNVRLMYTHPAHFSDELVSTYARSQRLLHYVDLPIQHISDKILKDMGRKTDSEKIKKIISELRNKIPDICIRTSLIVGFPGEKDEDFAELLGFVREIRFDRLGVFCYSLEKETPASKFLNPVSEEVSDDRRHEIMKVQAEISLSKNLLLKGAVIDVGIDSIRGNIATGRTYRDAPDIDNTVILRIPQKKNVSPGDRVRAKIESVSVYELKGEIL